MLGDRSPRHRAVRRPCTCRPAWRHQFRATGPSRWVCLHVDRVRDRPRWWDDHPVDQPGHRRSASRRSRRPHRRRSRYPGARPTPRRANGAAGRWRSVATAACRRASPPRAQGMRMPARWRSRWAKPLAQGVGEAEKCAWVCDYYAQYGKPSSRDELHPTEASRSYVRSKALVRCLRSCREFSLLASVPFAAPALVAGNAGS